MTEQNYCKLCNAKLGENKGDALYYCLKCSEEQNKDSILQ